MTKRRAWLAGLVLGIAGCGAAPNAEPVEATSETTPAAPPPMRESDWTDPAPPGWRWQAMPMAFSPGEHELQREIAVEIARAYRERGARAARVQPWVESSRACATERITPREERTLEYAALIRALPEGAPIPVRADFAAGFGVLGEEMVDALSHQSVPPERIRVVPLHRVVVVDDGEVPEDTFVRAVAQVWLLVPALTP